MLLVQEELLVGRAQFLNAQTAAFQVLVRSEPVDLDGHLRHVRGRAGTLAGRGKMPTPV
jgi:hypothetical protein